jgi:glycosyltransferase involved in cell wall biosynthesis
LRVLFLVYRDFRNPAAVGGDFFLWELARGLSRLGHNVTLACSNFAGSKPRETRDGVEIIRMQGSLSLPLKIFALYTGKLKGTFDVVVEEAIGGQRLPFFCILYIKETLVAVWHQRHEKIFREQYPFFLAAVLCFLEALLAAIYRSRIIVTPSQGAKEKLVPLGFKEENIEVVYDGADEIFRNVKTDAKRERLVVCLGKMRKYKRFDHALFAFAHMTKGLKSPCRLVIAGKVSEIDRGYVNWLQKLARRLGIREHVEFMINISEFEKLDLLKKAKVLIQPSPVEGFSIVVLEANRCGTPVVVSDGVPRDVVVDGYNGFIYPFGNIEALAAGIARLMDDELVWSRMSGNAHEWSKRFTWERSVSKFAEILARARKRHRRSASIAKLTVAEGKAEGKN